MQRHLFSIIILSTLGILCLTCPLFASAMPTPPPGQVSISRIFAGKPGTVTGCGPDPKSCQRDEAQQLIVKWEPKFKNMAEKLKFDPIGAPSNRKNKTPTLRQEISFTSKNLEREVGAAFRSEEEVREWFKENVKLTVMMKVLTEKQKENGDLKKPEAQKVLSEFVGYIDRVLLNERHPVRVRAYLEANRSWFLERIQDERIRKTLNKELPPLPTTQPDSGVLTEEKR